MKVLLVDQFADWTSPYKVHHTPIAFEQLVEQGLARAAEDRTCYGTAWPRITTRVLEVDENYLQPPMCSTVYRADAEGMAQTWMMRWDSSG